MKKSVYTLLFLLALGCEQDHINISGENVSNQSPLEIIQSQFSLNNFVDSLGLIKNNLLVDWDSFTINEFESVKWYEFVARQLVVSQTEKGVGNDESFTLLAFIDQKGHPNYSLSRFVSYDEDNSIKPTYFNTAAFTGINYLYDMQGQLSTMRFIRKGEDVSTVVDISQSLDGLPVIPTQCMQKAPVNGTCSTSLDCMLSFSGSGSDGTGGGCGGGGTGGWVTQTTYYYTDWFMSRGNGIWEYQNTQYDGSSTEWVWVERTGFGGTNGSYDKDSYRYGESDYTGRILRYLNNKPTEQPDFKLIVDKAKMKNENPCVFAALMGLTRFVNDPLKPEIFTEAVPLDFLQQFEQPATLTEFILSFFNASREFDYEITIGKINDKNAVTTKDNVSIKHRIITTISNTYSKSATQLSIVRTLIHESLHAYLVAIGRPGTDVAIELNKIAIEKGYIGTSGDLNKAHHELMSAYITALAASLKKWDQLNGSGGTLGDEYYFALATAGLFQVDVNGNFVNKTDFFKNLPIDFQNFAKKVVLNEALGNSEARGVNCQT